jgi:RNA polymerase sigma-70 factor (ECF subfamily)
MRDCQQCYAVHQANCLPAVLTAFEPIPIRYGIRIIEHASSEIETDTVLAHVRSLFRGGPFKKGDRSEYNNKSVTTKAPAELPINTLATSLVLTCRSMLEAALMLEARREVSSSFDDIVHQRETCVLRTAFRILGNWADAEDVAQEVFLRLHRHGLLFETEAAFGSWMYRVTVNLCLDKTRRRTARPSVEMPDLPSKDLSAEASVIRDQEKEQLMAALETLPPRERAAIVLREIGDFRQAKLRRLWAPPKRRCGVRWRRQCRVFARF